MPQASFTIRALADTDPSALALAAAAGPHGSYVTNALHDGEHDGFAIVADGVERGLCWFGRRGNLIVIGADDLPGEQVAAAILGTHQPWRIAMGPAAAIDALRAAVPGKPLVHRDQVYYRAAPAEAAAVPPPRSGVRAAERADRDRLLQATLQLNHSDLNIDPARVDRRWLRDSIDERIADGSTRVLGPLGSLDCKLDFGSRGPGGLVIEGVFTFPEARGRGLAAALVAAVVRDATGPVCLHVGAHNAPARAAYERAGMQAVARCRLLLLG
jgi:GNAT superfamily N-acetyltransferase